ncbi:hypothetical protein SAMN06295905_0181 [Devosia lucknowensis]|uniref:Uncharacterized protein n=1 Tax=Devosia lucknowensis TaxID=1096929 RepID=A0A1Y6EG22_9HYPH|nr:hypothetical protein [Devosia lucknowensis]SMQ59103.1 hypothetical protein SAMN06295905_0181 [Devosia lucknowensis]
MSSNVLEDRSVVLRLEFSIADAVHQRGLFSVLASAIRAWWSQRPINYALVPDYLREDVGLPPAEDPFRWVGVDLHAYRLHPPDRSGP